MTNDCDEREPGDGYTPDGYRLEGRIEQGEPDADSAWCPICEKLERKASRIAALCGAHDHALVAHVDTMTVGRLRGVRDAGEFVDINGRAMTVPVVLLDTGDAFVAADGAFAMLDEHTWTAAGDAIGEACRLVMGFGAVTSAMAGSDPSRCTLALRCALAAQLRALSPRG